MRAYVLSVAGMALLTSVISVLIPTKKYRKTIQGILKLCMLLVLVSPIFRYIGQDATTFFSSESIFGQDFAYINNSYSLAIEKHIESQFGVTATANIDILISEEETAYTEHIKNVKIYISDFGMNEEEEHINIITQIVESVKKLFDCNGVEVYDATDEDI